MRTHFLDAAVVFGPQKGATPAQVAMLSARLAGLAVRYREEFGVDVTELDGGGAAGGLGGGLAALGGRLRAGFDLVADELELDDRIRAADVVVTGEGYLDAQSFDGKVVGGICQLAAGADRRVVVIVGDADPTVTDGAIAERCGEAVTVLSLVERYGTRRAMDEPRWCIEHAAAEALGAR